MVKKGRGVGAGTGQKCKEGGGVRGAWDRLRKRGATYWMMFAKGFDGAKFACDVFAMEMCDN